MKRLVTALLAALLAFQAAQTQAQAQDQKRVREQQRVVEQLQKKIAAEAREIEQLKKNRSAGEERVRRLARQIESRNRLLEETRSEQRSIRSEIARADSTVKSLSKDLTRMRDQYAEMVRMAYENYRRNDYLTYLFSSHDFADAARRISNLREMAALRERRMQEIKELSSRVKQERTLLDGRKSALDSVSRQATAQRKSLEQDAASARSDISRLSRREQEALKRKLQQEQQLDAAISELRKLTKGNREGASFSATTSGLHLPVVGGRVKRYKENMAEITGPSGARVIAIYEGKVVDVKRNRITDKFDVFVAHGEYITSYANLGSVTVEKGQKVAKDAPLGTIGSSVDFETMTPEYKLIFGIYAPNPATKLKAENCFRK